MPDHALLLVPLYGDLHHRDRRDLFDPAHPKYLGTQAQEEAASWTEVGTFAVDVDVYIARNLTELHNLRPKLRGYKYLTLDIHGEPPSEKGGVPPGKLCAADDDEPKCFNSFLPSELGLRGGNAELVIVASCHQLERTLNRSVPKGCRVVSYKTLLKHGSANGLSRHACHARDFLDIEIGGEESREIVSQRVKDLARNSLKLDDWLIFESD